MSRRVNGDKPDALSIIILIIIIEIKLLQSYKVVHLQDRRA